MASGESVGVDAMQCRRAQRTAIRSKRVQGCWTARCATAAAVVMMTDEEVSGSQTVGVVKNLMRVSQAATGRLEMKECLVRAAADLDPDRMGLGIGRWLVWRSGTG